MAARASDLIMVWASSLNKHLRPVELAVAHAEHAGEVSPAWGMLWDAL